MKSRFKGVAIQLYTLTYSIACVLAPLIINLFLIPLNSSFKHELNGCSNGNDELSLSELSTASPELLTKATENFSSNSVSWFSSIEQSTVKEAFVLHVHVRLKQMMEQAVSTNENISLLNNVIANQTFSLSNINKTLLAGEMTGDMDVGLVKWAFTVASGGGLLSALMIVLFSKHPVQLIHAFVAGLDDKEMTSIIEIKPQRHIKCLYALFSILTVLMVCGWAFTTGVMSQYMQTFTILGLHWTTEHASQLYAVFGSGQLVGRIIALLLSSYVSRRPDAVIAICLIVWPLCPLLMLLADADVISEAIGLTVMGVFVAGKLYYCKIYKSLLIRLLHETANNSTFIFLHV